MSNEFPPDNSNQPNVQGNIYPSYDRWPQDNTNYDDIVDAEIVGEWPLSPRNHDQADPQAIGGELLDASGRSTDRSPIPYGSVEAQQARQEHARRPQADHNANNLSETLENARNADREAGRTLATVARETISRIHDAVNPRLAELPAASTAETTPTDEIIDPDEDQPEPAAAAANLPAVPSERFNFTPEAPGTPEQIEVANYLAAVAVQIDRRQFASHDAIRAIMGAPAPITEAGRQALANGSPEVRAAEAAKDRMAWAVTQEMIRQGVISTGLPDFDAQILASGYTPAMARQFGGNDGLRFKLVANMRPPRQNRRGRDGEEQPEAETPLNLPPEERAFREGRISRSRAFQLMHERLLNQNPSQNLMDILGEHFDTNKEGEDPRTMLQAIRDNRGPIFPRNYRKDEFTHIEARHTIPDEEPEAEPQPWTPDQISAWVDINVQKELNRTFGMGSRFYLPRTMLVVKGMVGRHPLKRLGNSAADMFEEYWGPGFQQRMEEEREYLEIRKGVAPTNENLAEEVTKDLGHYKPGNPNAWRQAWTKRALTHAFDVLDKRAARNRDEANRRAAAARRRHGNADDYALAS